MTPQIDSYTTLLVVYWLAMIPIAAFILIRVNGFLIDDYPSTFVRAMGLAVATPVVMFLAFDIASYILVYMMQDPSIGLRFPANYSYLYWIREPMALKWQALRLLPFIRFVPIVTAIVAGAVMQVLIWKIPFPHGLLILIAQQFLNLCAMVVLSLVFRAGIDALGGEVPAAAAEQQAQANPAQDPADLPELCRRVREAEAGGNSFWLRLGRGWESVNGLLAPLYRLLQPLTNHFPVPVQDWLNSGGWLLVPFGVWWLVYLVRRLRRSPTRPRRRSKARAG